MIVQLRLVGYAPYCDSATTYREWEFLDPEPSLGIGVGWRLLETDPATMDEPEFRFEVRPARGSLEGAIHLEEWQVIPLLGGSIPEWNPPLNLSTQYRQGARDVLDLAERTIDVLRKQFGYSPRYEDEQPKAIPKPKVEPEVLPEVVHARRLVPERAHRFSAVLMVDVPQIGAKRGDVLSHVEAKSLRDGTGGVVRWLTLEDYAVLAEVLAETDLADFCPGEPYFSVMWFLRRPAGWGKRLKVWRSRLALVRAPSEVVDEPIRANCDEAAIFELLCQVGGRMPQGG